MDLQHFLTAADVRAVNDDAAIKTAGTQQRWIQNVRTVGSSDQDDAFIRFKAVHLNKELVQRLLALVVSATQACAAGDVRLHRFRR